MAATLGGWRVTRLDGRRRHSVSGVVLTFAITKLNRRRETAISATLRVYRVQPTLASAAPAASPLRPTRSRRPETPHRHNPLIRRSPLHPTSGVINYPHIG
ncbi:MAG: hypothetical protein AUI15_23440 [Actinobacteria bacterium 13_2_20CM_2_66_6]|nr:MAG: hypothetical protein AUI15_23440 [Actinobacteria bacterium 13_2_20CM_2_66_6]